MPEKSIGRKADKLAAARKRLKEYQAKEKRDVELLEQGISKDLETPLAEHFSDNFSSSELNIVSDSMDVKELSSIAGDKNITVLPLDNSNEISVDTIQILINEKAILSSELNKFRSVCREKEFENEELQTQLRITSKRLDEMKRDFLLQLKSQDELKASNLTIQVQMQNIKSLYDDQAEHLEETKQLLAIEKTEHNLLHNQLKDLNNKLGLNKIRINQLSDEANITNDSRVEALTQTQFMHEQQIRDLQAMVQQLNRDKEQANQQYQTYVQHLSTEITKLNEQNSELKDECSKHLDNEKKFIDHIDSLEKEIQKWVQKNIVSENLQSGDNVKYDKEVEHLNMKVLELESERCGFDIRIKSQEELIGDLNRTISDRDIEITELKEHIKNILSEKPDNIKLLAAMESNNIAASRAITQNHILKKQLDELEIKFVQLTNDKVDLVNKVDAEEYYNREIRNNLDILKEQLNNLKEKLHYKDEEMIRLTHENNDLMLQHSVLQEQMDRLQHLKINEYSDKCKPAHNDSGRNESEKAQDTHLPLFDVNDYQLNCNRDDYILNDNEYYNNNKLKESNSSFNECDQAKDDNDLPPIVFPEHDEIDSYHCLKHDNDEPPTIPTMEALQKLQSRFTKLMVQVADLSEEKQRLEHLVLQLQGETETIGEYIALYQTQRRILKQREYEKAAQLELLLGERKEMLDKMTTLNKLVSNLRLELPKNLQSNEKLQNAMEPFSIEPNVSDYTVKCDEKISHGVTLNKRLISDNSEEILLKVQGIITEIKENTKKIPLSNTIDHLTCCSGKFETV